DGGARDAAAGTRQGIYPGRQLSHARAEKSVRELGADGDVSRLPGQMGRVVSGGRLHRRLGLDDYRGIANSFDVASARPRCMRLRRRILDISQMVSALHGAGAFSCLELVDCIHNGLMRGDAGGNSPDRFVLSKGHGAMALYAVLEDRGVLSARDLDTYCRA